MKLHILYDSSVYMRWWWWSGCMDRLWSMSSCTGLGHKGALLSRLCLGKWYSRILSYQTMWWALEKRFALLSMEFLCTVKGSLVRGHEWLMWEFNGETLLLHQPKGFLNKSVVVFNFMNYISIFFFFVSTEPHFYLILEVSS